MDSDQALVLAAPGIGPAVVRVGESSHSRFVPVINRRGSRPGHLQQHRLAHDLHAHVFHSSCRAQILQPADHTVCAGQKARVIVVGQLVHADLKGRRRKGFLAGAEGSSPENLRVAVALLIAGIAVFIHSGEEKSHRFHEELVVHDGIPLVSLQPFPGIHIVFRDDDRFGVGLLDSLAEPFPENMVEGLGIAQIRRHVQTPAVSAVRRGHPLAGDPKDILTELLRLLVVEFWKSAEIPPGIVTVVRRPVIVPEAEIIHIGGFF